MDPFQSQNSSITSFEVDVHHATGGPNQAKLRVVIYVLICFFVVGVVGNFLALLILARKRNSKNSKYTLMLRCLATNNLIGLLGMLTQLLVRNLCPKLLENYIRYRCIGLVVWRFFGLSSGCIAAVMAIERWMALARPFTYHKHITYAVVRKTIHSLISVATVITFLPFVGFGVYYDAENKKCLRYRNATTLLDMSYAYLFMIFGTLLCTVIVVCNLFVARVLYIIGRNKTDKKSVHYDLVNRERGSENPNGAPPLYHSQSNSSNSSNTSDEIKFAKLMAYLSISFVICWMPQMISVPLALMPNPLPSGHVFFRIADVLMALHFTSDPYIYVLSRTKHSYLLAFIKRWRLRGITRSQSDQSRLRPTIEQTLDYGLNT